MSFKCKHEPDCAVGQGKEKPRFSVTFLTGATVDDNGSVLDSEPHPEFDKESCACDECGATARWEG